MKCLVGIETIEGFTSSLNMLESLGVRDLHVEALHVVDPAKVYPGYGIFPSPEVPGQLISALEEHGEQLIRSCEQIAAEKCMLCTAKSQWGSAGLSLLDEAKSTQADLICVHRKQVSALDRLFLGSVSRAVLLGAEDSVLITKGKFKPRSQLSVVLGVDHSAYCMQCVDLLLKGNFRGIKKVLVVTAIDAKRKSDVEHEALRQYATAKNEAICQRFSKMNVEATQEVADGSAEMILHSAMMASKADLLVVGAQGHGFMDRLLVGSTSLHEVAVESYPVLVLRV